jgi:SnoaL-like domain
MVVDDERLARDEARTGDEARTKMEITEVIYRYCRAVDRMDRALASTVFHEGATADYGPTYSGSAQGLVENLWQNHSRLLGHSHQVSNILMEVDGDRAGSESYAFATLWDTTLEGALVVLTAYGRYLDRWSRRDGIWAIDHRRFVYDLVYPSTPSVAPEAVDAPLARLALRRNPHETAARRDRSDPSYEVLGAPFGRLE